ncbi:hypothetical protein VIGAN_01358400, partial [Vigna angularis var. angularis]
LHVTDYRNACISLVFCNRNTQPVTGYADLVHCSPSSPTRPWTFFIFNNHLLHSTNTQIVLLPPLIQPTNQNKLKPYDKPAWYVTDLCTCCSSSQENLLLLSDLTPDHYLFAHSLQHWQPIY